MYHHEYPPEYDGPTSQEEADALTAEAERQMSEWEPLDIWATQSEAGTPGEGETK